MGTVFPRQSDNMKLIAVLALAAVAFAEPEADPKADPWLTYGYYGSYPYTYGYRTYGAYHPYFGLYGKRSAEAEPEAEADPWYTYGLRTPLCRCLRRIQGLWCLPLLLWIL